MPINSYIQDSHDNNDMQHSPEMTPEESRFGKIKTFVYQNPIECAIGGILIVTGVGYLIYQYGPAVVAVISSFIHPSPLEPSSPSPSPEPSSPSPSPEPSSPSPSPEPSSTDPISRDFLMYMEQRKNVTITRTQEFMTLEGFPETLVQCEYKEFTLVLDSFLLENISPKQKIEFFNLIRETCPMNMTIDSFNALDADKQDRYLTICYQVHNILFDKTTE